MSGVREWHTVTDAGTRSMDDDNLRLWLGIAGVPMPSDADIAWLRDGE